jgi:hypothetical protein
MSKFHQWHRKGGIALLTFVKLRSKNARIFAKMGAFLESVTRYLKLRSQFHPIDQLTLPVKAKM